MTPSRYIACPPFNPVKFCLLVIVLATLWSMPLLATEEPSLKDVINDNETFEKSGEKTPTAKKAVNSQQKSRPAVPIDELERGVPRTSVVAFYQAADEGDFQRAAEYLDLRHLPFGMNSDDGPELAKQLKIVLDRALWIDPEILSTEPQGNPNDGLYRTRDHIGVVQLHDGEHVDLILQRIPRDDGVLIWKFAAATVQKIPELHKDYGYGPVGEHLSKILPSGQFLGLYLWQWIMAVGLLLIAYCIVYIPTKIAAIIINRRKTDISERVAAFISGPIRFLIAVIITGANIELIHPTMKARAIMKGQTLVTIISIWTVVLLFGILRDIFITKLGQKGAKTAIVLLRPITRVLQILTLVIGMMIWFENLGFKATTLLTGLGIGGLAVALAAQKSIENIIGAVTLFASAPVKIGDFGKFGDVMGTVEEIGLRYTYIRTRERTLVHIPNAVFADFKLENFTDREKIWYHPLIRLSRKTTSDQVRYILVEIRKMLYAHPAVDPDPARVRFKEFGSHSLDIDIYAYVSRTDYGQYLEVAEDLNLRIMDIVTEAGTELAVPVQNVWFENSAPADKDRTDAVHQQIQAWRDNNELCLPEFPKEKIDQLRNTLDYPPKGSASKE